MPVWAWESRHIGVSLGQATSPLGNQLKHSIVDYMHFIYDFPRWFYKMFCHGFILFAVDVVIVPGVEFICRVLLPSILAFASCCPILA